MHRRPGHSARLKLTLSYAGFLFVAGTLLLAVMWVFVLRWLPADDPRSLQEKFGAVIIVGPNRSDLLRGFAPAAATALAFLLVFGLLGDGSSPAGCSHRSHRSPKRHGWPGRGRCPTGSA